MALFYHGHMRKHVRIKRYYGIICLLYITFMHSLCIYGSEDNTISETSETQETSEFEANDLNLGYSNEALMRFVSHNVDIYDPSFALLVHIFNDPINPSRIPKTLATNSNRFWKALLKSHENLTFDDSKPSQVDNLTDADIAQPKLSHISTYRIVVTGYCAYAPETPDGRCSGQVHTDFDKSNIERMQKLLQNHESFVTLRIEGLGDLRRAALLGNENELAAQRIIRLILANPRYLLSPRSSGVASVTMITPISLPKHGINYNFHGALASRQEIVRTTAGNETESFSDGDRFQRISNSLPWSAGHRFGSWKNFVLDSLNFISFTTDKSVELLINMPEASFLNTEVVQQIFAIVNEPEAMSTMVFKANDADSATSATMGDNADPSAPPKKYLDINRINFKGTCRVVLSCTGDAVLLKTKKFGNGLSARQLRAQERMLVPKRLLLHVEIRGLGKNNVRSDIGKLYPLSYYIGGEANNKNNEHKPYPASEAAALICQGLRNPTYHPWGDAKVVLWDSHPSDTDEDTKNSSSSTFRSDISDYEIWKLIAVISVPAVFIGILLILSWRCSNTQRTGQAEIQPYKFHLYLPETSCSRLGDPSRPTGSPTRSDITLDINMENIPTTPSFRKCTSM